MLNKIPISRMRKMLNKLRKRDELKPNRELRDWAQIGTCQRLITSLEVIVVWSELARRWIGDPPNPLKRIVEELVRLNEG
jgi:hypothetical protein